MDHLQVPSIQADVILHQLNNLHAAQAELDAELDACTDDHL